MQELYCGTDIGTSSVKTVAFNENFKPIIKISNDYKLRSREKEWAELDPIEVYEAVLDSLLTCKQKAERSGYHLKFISFSSALHSLIAVDKFFNPLTDCITWADTRAMEFNSYLQEEYKKQEFYSKTGCPPHAIYMPAKILWLKKYRPEIFENTHKFITIKEYVLKQLTGESVVDYSLASGGGLLNIHQKTWEPGLLELLDIEEKQLGTLVDGKESLSLKPGLKQEFGEDIPLIVGSGDGPLANLGAGAFSSNQYVITVGSSGAVRVFADEPVLDPNNKTWCYMLDEDIYLPGGAINNGGIVLEWIQNNLFAGDNDEEFHRVVDQYIQETSPGSRGLLFLPFLTGERSPNWNPFARGLMIGLGLTHNTRDIARAAVEGIAFRMYAITRALQDRMGECDEILANGGFTNSEARLQLMADVFGTRIVAHSNPEASALGAVFMGLVASELVEDYRDIETDLDVKFVKEPDPEHHQHYKKIYNLQEKVYQRNSDIFKELAEI